MKTRQWFVSNSSSTSYIIAFKTIKKCKCCGRSESDLSEMIDQVTKYECIDDDTQIEAKGKDNVINFIKHEWSKWQGEEGADEMVQKVESFLKDKTDWTIISCQISYHNEIMNNVIQEKEKNKTLVKLWGDR